MPNPPPAPLKFYPAYCFSLSPTHNTWARLTASQVHALRERTGFEGTYSVHQVKVICFRATQQIHQPLIDHAYPPVADMRFPPPPSPGQNLFFHLNHPIKWIRLVGVIVAIDFYPTRWIALLDDSSGATIEITCGRSTPAPTTSLAKDTSTQLSGFEASGKGVTATGRAVDLSGVDIGTVVKVKGGVGSFREVRQMLLERICRSHVALSPLAFSSFFLLSFATGPPKQQTETLPFLKSHRPHHERRSRRLGREHGVSDGGARSGVGRR